MGKLSTIVREGWRYERRDMVLVLSLIVGTVVLIAGAITALYLSGHKVLAGIVLAYTIGYLNGNRRRDHG